MTLTIAVEGLGVLDNAEADTKWGIAGSGGSSIALDNEIFYQDVGSIASLISSGKNGWIYYNHGSTLNFTSTYSGQCIYVWVQTTTPGAMNTKATPGFSFRCGSSTTVYREWALAGSDDLNGWTGGWKCFVIDPTSAGTSDTGAYNANAVQYMGIYYNGSGSARAANVFVDTIAVGSGVRVIGTETTSGQGIKEVVDYCVDRANQTYGMVQEREGIYYIYGNLIIGGTTANTTVTDSGRVLQWGDSEYWSGSAWVSSIGDGFNKLTIEDHASYTTTYTDGTIVGTDSGRSGCVYIGAGSVTTTFDFYGGNNAASTTKLYGSSLKDIDGGITWGNDIDHDCFSVTMSACGQFDPVGAIDIKNCTFAETSSTTAAVKWNESIDMTSCGFIANAVGSGIEMPSNVGTPYAYNALLFSGNTNDVNNTSGNAIEINKNNGSNPTSYTGSTTTFLGVSVDTEITVKDITNGSLVNGARVLAWVTNNNNYFYQAGVGITGSGTTATVAHTGHGMITGDYVIISGVTNDDDYNGVHQVTVTNVNEYTYIADEVLGSTPATGTPISTFAVISGTTTSGVVKDTRSWSANQVISGRVRAASGSPLFQQGVISGEINKDNGVYLTVQLVRDE